MTTALATALAGPASALTGFGTGFGFIVAIGPQNAWVLRQGVRREHIGLVIAICALSDLILIATGSEVEITVLAAEKLLAKGVNVRVVSLPSTDVFDAQDEAWRESVLPSDVSARVAVEAGIADYWYKYVGLKGKIVGMTGYGESAPAEQLFPFFGFTVDHIVATAEQVLNG